MPSVAQTLIDGLRREGVTHVFGIPGTQNLTLLDVIRETPEIHFILTRHEQGVALWEEERKALTDPNAELIQPAFVADVLRRILPKGGIMVTGNAGKHVRQHFVSYAPDTYIFIDNWTAVGAGFPTALEGSISPAVIDVMIDKLNLAPVLFKA